VADAPNLGADFQLYTMGSDLYRLMPQIRSITVRGFRNLKSFSWQPAAGVNVLLGAGDTGKSNVLHAVSLFARNRALTEFDYFSRDVASGFSIDLVITGLALGDLASERSTLPIRGWNSSELTSLPQGGAVPALVFRAQGTSDLELEYKLVAESGEVYFLSAALRQQLNLIFLSRADDNLNNFRAQQGSLLSRNFTDVDFRSSALAVMQQAITTWSDPVEAKQTLSDLRSEFQTLGLPGDLLLGIIPPSGAAASKSVAVFQGKSVSESIPFELSGDGTRNLSVLVLASRLLSTTPILLADEVERGLEPLRQRVAAKLVSRIQSNQGQAIVVTHAPAVVETLAEASQWIMASAAPIRIPPRLNASVFRNQPEAAFAHLSMVCEGATEMGLVPPFWNHFIGSDLEENGVCLVDAGGHTVALEMLEDLLKAGMPCAGFVDNEVEKRGTRDTIGKQCPLFTWAPSRCRKRPSHNGWNLIAWRPYST